MESPVDEDSVEHVQAGFKGIGVEQAEPYGIGVEQSEADEQQEDHSMEEGESELDDEDRELIRDFHARQMASPLVEEPVASRRGKRVIEDSDEEGEKMKRARGLEDLFADEEAVMANDREKDTSSTEDEEEDDLHDFIEEPEEEERKEKEDSKKAKKKPEKALWGGVAISREAWNDLVEIFGDGSEYADLVWEEDGGGDEEEGDLTDEKSIDADMQAIPSRLSSRPHLDKHINYISEEADWIKRELVRSSIQLPASFSSPHLESMITLLRDHDVPFIAAFRKDQIGGLKVHHLWFIHDLDTRYIQLKRQQLMAGCQSLENADILAEWQRRLPSSSADHPWISPSQFSANCKAWAVINRPDNDISNKDFNTIQHLRAFLFDCDAVDPIARRMEAAATVSCEPSASGKKLSNRHELSSYLWMTGKPVAEFSESDQYLVLERGESTGLCSVNVTINDLKEITDQLCQLACCVDAQQTSVINELVDGLAERVCRRLKMRLSRAAHQWLARCCQYALQGHLLSRPVSSGLIAAVGCFKSSEESLNVSVVLVESESLEVKHAERLSFPNDMGAIIETLSPADQILVTGRCYQTVQLFTRLRDGLSDKLVQWGWDDVARLYTFSSTSPFPSAMEQAIGGNPQLRYSLLVALCWIDPLAVFACLPSGDLLKLDLIANQQYCDNELRLTHLQRAFIDVVNLRGAGMANPLSSMLLQYVCGLGPNASITAKSRSELHGSLPSIVYSNAAGFLRFPQSPHPFDSMCIHPEDYPFVEQMLRDAFVDDLSNQMDSFERAIVDLLHSVKGDPSRLLSLDLDDYARVIKERGGREMGMLLRDYRAELLRLSSDDAKSTVGGPSHEQVFWMLTGERMSSLQPGQMIRVRLTSIQSSSSALAILDGSGFPIRCMLSGRQPINRPLEAVVILCNPAALDHSEAVRVSMHPDDMNPRLPLLGVDPHVRPPKPSTSKDTRTTSVKQSVLPPSVIHHPLFKDISRQEAEKALQTGRVAGEAIIRPSASGPDPLTVSWRICSSCLLIQHAPLAISESGGYYLRDPVGGRRERFEDLDEVIARGIDPAAALLDAIAGCPKFLVNVHTREEAEAMLQSAQSKQPGRIVYGLWLSSETPGAAVLSVGPRRHELIIIENGEYLFRRRLFRSISDLVEHFKGR